MKIGTCQTCKQYRLLKNRGCCARCYGRHQAGIYTWQALEAAGLVLPARKQSLLRTSGRSKP